MGAADPAPAVERDGAITLIAGPCSVESLEQMREVASTLADLGIRVMRGGAYKPRSSPFSFQGLEEKGLIMLREAADEFGLLVVTEVTDSAHAEKIAAYTDILQIGTRNMANFSLLKKVGEVTAESRKPVVFKRGMAATIEEWLQASNYITMFGNENVILCERGIRTFETAYRFTLDITAVPVVKSLSLLPIIIDVSHPAGRADLVPALSRAAIAVGADGIMVEVHPNPREALCDGPQSLDLPALRSLVAELAPVAQSIGRTLG
ncbi:MAG: 3-deoxy-7-phosphoheptulonate synthase [Actinomycetota bacterium]|nr:MAG: phospho-2-dehydro-3-deoxyheptonate [Actinomycetota bacterium]MDO8949080.1 3-deoxy-7-phosphoheptulonate synthase [Actinomycetota bacterium]MDP3630577.1 3-deoxy-7-phosphoheptulonate synthase [Actinomycetota bacterium]